MKQSEKYLEKTYTANMPKIPYADIKRYGEYCDLEGEKRYTQEQINQLLEIRTDGIGEILLNGFRKDLTKLNTKLQQMAEEDKL